MSHPASQSDEALLMDCDVSLLRRSGPGGQHRNKTETAVVLVHRRSGLKSEANERRSQAENRRLSIFRMRLRLATDVRVQFADDQPISQLWRGRVANQRLSISSEHADFPTLLAEALDWLAYFEYLEEPAAERLLVTRSQLVRLLKKHRPAFERLNHERLRRGLRLLK